MDRVLFTYLLVLRFQLLSKLWKHPILLASADWRISIHESILASTAVYVSARQNLLESSGECPQANFYLYQEHPLPPLIQYCSRV